MTKTDPPSTATQPYERHEYRYYRWSIPIAVLALVASCAAACFSWWQAYLARQNNIISQRAFVYADQNISLMPLKDKDTGTLGVNIMMTIKNSGNTPTKNLEFLYRCAPSADALPEPWVLLYRGKVDRSPQIIGPQQTVKAACFFSLAQLQQMSEGKLRGYLLGDITYRDRLDPSYLHRTHFSFELMDINVLPLPQNAPADAVPGMIFAIQPRGQHNCADEDCPP